MKLDTGTLHTWTDDDTAHAQLRMEGSGARITLNAEVPLELVRRNLEARHPNGAAAAESPAVVEPAGRAHALAMLAKTSPEAFAPGGVAHAAAQKQVVSGLGRLRRRGSASSFAARTAAEAAMEGQAGSVGSFWGKAAGAGASRTPGVRRYSKQIQQSVEIAAAAQRGDPRAITMMAQAAKRKNQSPRDAKVYAVLKKGDQIATAQKASRNRSLRALAQQGTTPPGRAGRTGRKASPAALAAPAAFPLLPAPVVAVEASPPVRTFSFLDTYRRGQGLPYWRRA